MKKYCVIILCLLSSIAAMAQGTDTLVFHTVEVDPTIVHGTLNVRPTGEVQVGWRVSVTATPDENYHLESVTVHKTTEPNVTVELVEEHFVMPDFDVMVTAVFESDLPVIEGEITAPAAICAGGSLELTAPVVQLADSQGWEMAPNDSFQHPTAYTDQPLDASYNGWKLRYWASNRTGTVYSNVVGITVNEVKEVTIAGDAMGCTMQECEYSVRKEVGLNYSWEVSDASATVTVNSNTVKVCWSSAGTQKVSVQAENPTTGCSANAELSVKVQSYVNPSDLNAIVAKKRNGKEYILIYPNPKDQYRYQWYKDGQKIAGANGQYYYQEGGLDAGVYKLYLSFNADANGNLFGGAFTDDYIVWGVTKLDIYPNPAQEGDNLVVVNEAGNEVVVAIYSMEGRLVHRQTVSGTQAVISTDLMKGIYMVHLSNGNSNKIQKIIIK